MPPNPAPPSSTAAACALRQKAASGRAEPVLGPAKPDPGDGAKRKKGSKLHLAVDTLGHLLALHVTPADADDRAEVEQLAKAVQTATGQSVDLAYVDQGFTGERAVTAARAHGIELEVVKLPEAKRGFVLLPRPLRRA